MPEEQIICSRCGKTVDGFRDELATAGFYDVRPNQSCGWSKFANAGETNVCDTCMWNDSRYQALYGDLNARNLSKQP